MNSKEIEELDKTTHHLNDSRNNMYGCTFMEKCNEGNIINSGTLKMSSTEKDISFQTIDEEKEKYSFNELLYTEQNGYINIIEKEDKPIQEMLIDDKKGIGEVNASNLDRISPCLSPQQVEEEYDNGDKFDENNEGSKCGCPFFISKCDYEKDFDTNINNHNKSCKHSEENINYYNNNLLLGISENKDTLIKCDKVCEKSYYSTSESTVLASNENEQNLQNISSYETVSSMNDKIKIISNGKYEKLQKKQTDIMNSEANAIEPKDYSIDDIGTYREECISYLNKIKDIPHNIGSQMNSYQNNNIMDNNSFKDENYLIHENDFFDGETEKKNILQNYFLVNNNNEVNANEDVNNEGDDPKSFEAAVSDIAETVGNDTIEKEININDNCKIEKSINMHINGDNKNALFDFDMSRQVFHDKEGDENLYKTILNTENNKSINIINGMGKEVYEHGSDNIHTQVENINDIEQRTNNMIENNMMFPSSDDLRFTTLNCINDINNESIVKCKRKIKSDENGENRMVKTEQKNVRMKDELDEDDKDELYGIPDKKRRKKNKKKKKKKKIPGRVYKVIVRGKECWRAEWLVQKNQENIETEKEETKMDTYSIMKLENREDVDKNVDKMNVSNFQKKSKQFSVSVYGYENARLFALFELIKYNSVPDSLKEEASICIHNIKKNIMNSENATNKSFSGHFLQFLLADENSEYSSLLYKKLEDNVIQNVNKYSIHDMNNTNRMNLFQSQGKEIGFRNEKDFPLQYDNENGHGNIVDGTIWNVQNNERDLFYNNNNNNNSNKCRNDYYYNNSNDLVKLKKENNEKLVTFNDNNFYNKANYINRYNNPYISNNNPSIHNLNNLVYNINSYDFNPMHIRNGYTNDNNSTINISSQNSNYRGFGEEKDIQKKKNFFNTNSVRKYVGDINTKPMDGFKQNLFEKVLNNLENKMGNNNPYNYNSLDHHINSKVKSTYPYSNDTISNDATSNTTMINHGTNNNQINNETEIRNSQHILHDNLLMYRNFMNQNPCDIGNGDKNSENDRVEKIAPNFEGAFLNKNNIVFKHNANFNPFLGRNVSNINT
ncbi:conserved Plasmodium protein, unknown function [Plasmodium chabaudi chabaudi]|uniref:Uncharacterized protein n=1 Tax=Plasmodium chabaudi chabaudi TaxID=31271 RepID=A0A4V0K466_PLACU|nr:conserved Plasmodium protein, unknown function [Plasmodium chabaudi chabaudi]VTZ67737.1 conserved Plasmodium protein, unknown function [Plasmodium chabaudi chabaudi]|eukprot:XP_731758.2 conserved Plasmodium protein, unknown function [Plasmodium chabaudi chabaudi]